MHRVVLEQHITVQFDPIVILCMVLMAISGLFVPQTGEERKKAGIHLFYAA